jgi:hypothetical protein
MIVGLVAFVVRLLARFYAFWRLIPENALSQVDGLTRAEVGETRDTVVICGLACVVVIGLAIVFTFGIIKRTEARGIH